MCCLYYLKKYAAKIEIIKHICITQLKQKANKGLEYRISAPISSRMFLVWKVFQY